MSLSTWIEIDFETICADCEIGVSPLAPKEKEYKFEYVISGRHYPATRDMERGEENKSKSNRMSKLTAPVSGERSDPMHRLVRNATTER